MHESLNFLPADELELTEQLGELQMQEAPELRERLIQRAVLQGAQGHQLSMASQRNLGQEEDL